MIYAYNSRRVSDPNSEHTEQSWMELMQRTTKKNKEEEEEKEDTEDTGEASGFRGQMVDEIVSTNNKKKNWKNV